MPTSPASRWPALRLRLDAWAATVEPSQPLALALARLSLCRPATWDEHRWTVLEALAEDLHRETAIVRAFALLGFAMPHELLELASLYLALARCGCPGHKR